MAYKICYIITRSDWGGAQVHLESLINNFRKNNEIVLIVGEEGELTKRLINLNVKIYVIKELKRSISLKDIWAVVKIKKIIDYENPDLVHLHSSKAGLIGRIAAKISNNKLPVIFTVHGWAFTPGTKKINKALGILTEKIFYRMIDQFICVSNYDKEIAFHHNFEEKKMITVYNGVKSSFEKKYTEINKKNIVFTMVARFNEQKDQMLLLEAVNQLKNKNILINFVGEGENLGECVEYVQKNNLAQNVNFLGFRSNPMSILINSDVFVLTSFYEGLPISIIEAMSIGLPIVASNVGGNRELVIDGENGYLINDLKELKLALTNLVEQEKLRDSFGMKSKDRFESFFTEEKCIKNTKEVYKKIIGGELK